MFHVPLVLKGLDFTGHISSHFSPGAEKTTQAADDRGSRGYKVELVSPEGWQSCGAVPLCASGEICLVQRRVQSSAKELGQRSPAEGVFSSSGPTPRATSHGRVFTPNGDLYGGIARKKRRKKKGKKRKKNAASFGMAPGKSQKHSAAAGTLGSVFC